MPIVIDDSWYERTPEARERVSAGGVVIRIEGGNLLVGLVREIDAGETLEGYVLPKGRLEPGEAIDAGAVREIHEEIGITEVEKLGDLATLERLDLTREFWSINHYGLYLTAQPAGEIVDKDHHFDFGWFPLEDPPHMFWPDERRMLARQRGEIYDAVIAHQNPKSRKKYFV